MPSSTEKLLENTAEEEERQTNWFWYIIFQVIYISLYKSSAEFVKIHNWIKNEQLR